jgi:hypothetical protein
LVSGLFAENTFHKLPTRWRTPRDPLQTAVERTKLISEEIDIPRPPTTGKIEWQDGLPGGSKIDQDAAQPLQGIAGVGDKEQVGDLQAARLKEGKGVMDDRTDIRLQVRCPVAGVDPRWTPDLNRENVKSP